MFEWLEEEISAIKTHRFHVVEGPIGQDLEIRSSLPLPSSYREFILRFGNAKLYRNARNNSYRIGVFASPREEVLNDGTHIYQIGFHDGAKVYIKPRSNPTQFPISEFEEDWEEVANDFEEWLVASCSLARSKYGDDKWADIVRGPKPFTPEEEEIIEARRSIHWRQSGVDADGNHIFEVKNAGSRALPALTVGVRSRNRRLNGAVRLDIRHVGPGQTEVLHVNCYRGLVMPSEIEVFALPDPRPEDRESYYEFAEIGGIRDQ
jgi:hypothetical protein